MASTPITEYERKRLENIKRNEQMMASLKLRSKAQQSGNQIIQNISQETQIKRTNRNPSISPDVSTAKGIDDDLIPPSPVKTPIRKVETRRYQYGRGVFVKVFGPATVKDMSDNVPLGRRLIGKGTGNRFGNIVFWDVDCQEDGNDGIYLYQPHTANVSGISIKPFSLSKVYSSSYDGLLRQLDFEKESFDLVYSTDDTIFSLSQWAQDADSIYFSEGSELLNVWDTRAGKSSSSWMLHEKRINTIDFNPENTNLMVTSSTDGSACIWDLRLMNTHKPKNLKIIKHNKAVHSAYFSPSGKCLVTTRAIWGWDDTHIFIGSMSREVDVISTTGSMSSLRSSDVSAIPCRFAAHPSKVVTLAAATSGGQIYLWTQS